MAETKGKKIITKVLKVLLYVAISFVCLLALVLLYYVINSQIHANDENYRPTVSIYTIVSPSMTPVINVYDVVINVKADTPKDIEVGDIITYKSQSANSEGMTITHRVIAIDQLPDGTYEYLTQGDNNSEPDSLYVTFDNVIGKEIMIIPGLGRLQFLIANHKWWLILLIIPIGIYLVREIFKLIDLFNLRNKVDRITGEKEESIIVKKKIENIERKEKIKEELEIRELERDAIKRSSEEPEGFLEKYTETMVIVPVNKYDKQNKPKPTKPSEEETPVIAPSKPIEEPTPPKEVKKESPKEKEVELPKTKAKVVEEKQTEEINKDVKEKSTNDQYEILDTDELSTKIKEYDSKISQLDKMIKDMESISKTTPEVEQEMPEVDDFLQGSRIKVIKVELTNNNEEVRKERRKKKEEQIDLSENTISPNPNKKIARPDSIDIKELRSNVINDTINEPIPTKEKKTSKKNHLNLNPRNVKKVTRPNRSRGRRNLNLNPTNIKKVRRPRVLAAQEKMNKQVNNPTSPQNLRPQESSQPKPKKEKFIKIERIKK